jgi:uncharacterized coiled-coil protein SlyX
MTGTKEKTLDQLNLTLSSQQFDAYLFMKLIEKLLTEQASELEIIDLKNNTEAALCDTLKEINDNVVKQNYEIASRLRDKEICILEHIRLRRNLEIERSRFVVKNGTLLYFYLGNERHDDVAFHLLSRKSFL